MREPNSPTSALNRIAAAPSAAREWSSRPLIDLFYSAPAETPARPGVPRQPAPGLGD